MANITLYRANGFLPNDSLGGGAGAAFNTPAQANTGAGGSSGGAGGMGGHSGEQRLHWITDGDVPNSQITITIGAGGVGGNSSNGNGGNGGTTSVGALVSASGGQGGFGSDGISNGFAGGSGYVIILTFA